MGMHDDDAWPEDLWGDGKDEDYFGQDTFNRVTDGSPRATAPGKWIGAQNQIHIIQEMDTSHIINCMKLLERKMWAQIRGLTHSDIEARAVTGGACSQLDMYREFENELMKRIKAKKVTLGDFFMAIRAKNVRVIK